MDLSVNPEKFPDLLQHVKHPTIPPYLPDLARIEWAIYQSHLCHSENLSELKTVTVNPSLKLIPVFHRNLPVFIRDESGVTEPVIQAEGLHVLVWCDPKNKKIQYREAEDADLLALKIVLEKVKTSEAAREGGVTVGSIEAVLQRGIAEGILLSPPSRIARSESVPDMQKDFLSAGIFTLQWHITQACDLHCKHCYDRNPMSSLPYEQALSVIDDFYDFCRRMNVRGQITFTGGNPLLYPDFKEIYQETSVRGFGIAILGNPSPRAQVEELLTIDKPLFFQISLEGLEAHNDTIRGEGHFQRSLMFLDQLREMDIYSMVMLTLTRDNLDQVLPLGELLSDRADYFTFNRLSNVGEGADLLMVDPEQYEIFLRKYLDETPNNRILGLKDNLFNIIRQQYGTELFGGCTGYGCGAAFNFVSLLADGDVHACRKFPSPIGNIKKNRLFDIYRSEAAEKYRKGSSACRDCSLNLVCRGCPAIVHSAGLDVFRDKDPFCFYKN